MARVRWSLGRPAAARPMTIALSPASTRSIITTWAKAVSAGIENASTIRDFEDFKKVGVGALSKNELSFIVCKVDESLMHREIPRPNTDLAENKYTFVRYLERTEERVIPFVGRG